MLLKKSWAMRLIKFKYFKNYFFESLWHSERGWNWSGLFIVEVCGGFSNAGFKIPTSYCTAWYALKLWNIFNVLVMIINIAWESTLNVTLDLK